MYFQMYISRWIQSSLCRDVTVSSGKQFRTHRATEHLDCTVYLLNLLLSNTTFDSFSIPLCWIHIHPHWEDCLITLLDSLWRWIGLNVCIHEPRCATLAVEILRTNTMISTPGSQATPTRCFLFLIHFIEARTNRACRTLLLIVELSRLRSALSRLVLPDTHRSFIVSSPMEPNILIIIHTPSTQPHALNLLHHATSYHRRKVITLFTIHSFKPLGILHFKWHTF